MFYRLTLDDEIFLQQITSKIKIARDDYLILVSPDTANKIISLYFFVDRKYNKIIEFVESNWSYIDNGLVKLSRRIIEEDIKYIRDNSIPCE